MIVGLVAYNGVLRFMLSGLGGISGVDRKLVIDPYTRRRGLTTDSLFRRIVSIATITFARSGNEASSNW